MVGDREHDHAMLSDDTGWAATFSGLPEGAYAVRELHVPEKMEATYGPLTLDRAKGAYSVTVTNSMKPEHEPEPEPEPKPEPTPNPDPVPEPKPTPDPTPEPGPGAEQPKPTPEQPMPEQPTPNPKPQPEQPTKPKPTTPSKPVLPATGDGTLAHILSAITLGVILFVGGYLYHRRR